ncbi:hypothetical protein MHTCC0001_22360 [Flavobacteriaceae bacterium MHTCC 0001]
MLAITGALFVGCKAEPLEGDEEAPIIEIISPSDNSIFYTSDSTSAPNSIQIHARATDNNAVVFGILTITDANGDLVDADVESNFSENETVLDLIAEFATEEAGVYTINFLFRDANDNNASVTRTIQCLKGDTEEEQQKALTLQLFGSDRGNETVIRVDFYNDDTVEEIVLANTINDAKSIVPYLDENELLFGTNTGFDVDVVSVSPTGENLVSTNVSNSNYLFSTVAKDHAQQTIYYFLEGGNLNKVPHHRLYKMDADGSNKTLVTQVENATRANAIDKILIYENSGATFLIMHSRNAVYLYNPESENSLDNSVVFSTDQLTTIHDIAIDASNKMIYMILSRYESVVDNTLYYTVATTNFDGDQTDLSVVEIAQNHPVTSQFHPHRMKLDIKNEHVYWFTESDDLQKSILKRASFNDTGVQTIWETNTCLCTGEVEDIRIEDYQIITESFITGK